MREELVNQSVLAKTEQAAGLVRIAQRQTCVLERRRRDHADQRILLRLGEHHRAQSGARPERMVDLTQSLDRIGIEHEAKPADRSIEGCLGEAKFLTVGYLGLHIREA